MDKAKPARNGGPIAVDRPALVRRLSGLARVPTHVDLGWDTLIAPDHPRLVHYVQEVIRPALLELGAIDLIHVPPNDLVVVLGSERPGPPLLIQNYTPAQHHNRMAEPTSGRVARITRGDQTGIAVFGQGVSQAKAHQASMLAVVELVLRSEGSLPGPVYWAVNNEGRSSHDRSTAIIEALPRQPAFAVIQHGTRSAISLGNRGRVDLQVRITGKATHSSRPDDGASAIDGAQLAIERLRRLTWPDKHPILGSRQAIPYKIRYDPVAPHTLPETAELTIDRRLLPGDGIEAARREVAEAIGSIPPFEVEVVAGVAMLPALVEPDAPGVVALARAFLDATGRPATMTYAKGTFDAGGPTSFGIPTVMFGASGGDWPLGDDYVFVDDVVEEAVTLLGLIFSGAPIKDPAAD